MSPVLRSASPRAKSVAISAAGTRGFTDGSVGAAAETAAAAGAALSTGAGFAAAVAGKGFFESVAGSALPVGAVVVTGGGDVGREALVDPELVFAVDPNGVPAASTAGASGSAGAGSAVSGGGPTGADPRSDALVLRGAPSMRRTASTCTDACWGGAAFGTAGGEKTAFADLSRSAFSGRRSAPVVVA